MQHFTLRVMPSPEPKLVISVSKKVAKKAVTRNLVKRRVRAVVRNMSLKPAKYLFIARAGSENVKGKDLEEELLRIIRSIRN